MSKFQIKFNRFLSALMAFITVFGLVGSLSILPVYAAEAEEEEEIIDYYTQVYNSSEDKIAAMEMRADAFGYQLYYEDYSGEVALYNKASGQALFTNPYDLAFTPEGFSTPTDDTKSQLLSQIIIKYTDTKGQEKNYYSFVEAAKREQIKSKNVKNGIRVEYTIGEEETRNLVPMLIERSRFEEWILAYVDDEQALKKLNAFYTLKDPEDPKLTVRGVKELQATFPITTKMAVYVFDPYASAREINLIESYIKQWCPHYTFSELDADHSMTEYEGATTAPPLFKMSLEYYLTEDGMQVRLPANGIRFDEGTYKLTYIQILPYLGAGQYNNEGYTFIPDGSGTIIRFEDFAKQNVTVSGKLYGQDYAYHEISGAHQQVMRLPVYGVVENYKHDYTVDVVTEVTGEDGKVTEETTTEEYSVKEDRGYVAIITEGDALANITTSHGGALHRYCTVYTQFYPRPKDSYNLQEAISVAQNATWTVVSKRKYTGSYRIDFMMLTDSSIAKSKKINDYYKVSWEGMAHAYRDYLLKNEYISPITDAKADVPLYVETFGVIDTQETILSIPVIVKTPLTTFDNLKSMYDQLSADGVSNIIYKLTGYTNGGFDSTMPTKVKFEKKTGGNNGYKDFLNYASSKGVKVYPDFDFAYVGMTDAFDGFSYRTDAVKTIDNRYTMKREYDAAWQRYLRNGFVAVAPSVYEKFFTKFEAAIDKLGYSGISVSTLGSDLNSDFDKKEPYNREDSKEQTIKMLENLYNKYGALMLDSGNAYTLKYAGHILDVALDSSQYYYSSQSVPFVGMVLHGHIPFAGTPTNMAGDINYEVLKIIENGASPYFVLSYQNTAKMKEYYTTSKYYSVAYDIWYNDLIKYYNIINDALKDQQTATIESHEFLWAERIPTDDEIADDKAEAKAIAEAEAEVADKLAAKEERAKKLADRKAEEARLEAIANGEEIVEEAPAEEAPAAEVEEEVEEVEEVEEDTGYKKTKYTCALGTVVKVTYSSGVSFILNYNSYAIKAEGKTVEPLGFVRIG